ncbi:MAG: hypothetical protein ACPG80_00915, partial [Rickettsiales bacterium]
VSFEQDDSAHDALADVGPLVYIFADQYRAFGRKVMDMSGLWRQTMKEASTRNRTEAMPNGDVVIKFPKGTGENMKSAPPPMLVFVRSPIIP